MYGNHEAVVIELVLFLALLGLVAIEAVRANGGVLAHFEFVNDGILLPRMAFCAFPGGLDEGCINANAMTKAMKTLRNGINPPANMKIERGAKSTIRLATKKYHTPTD
jgi:hypothetical protein